MQKGEDDIRVEILTENHDVFLISMKHLSYMFK